MQKAIVHNFNCTFNDGDDPMIAHFNKIVYPAFTSNILRHRSGNSYVFDFVELKKINSRLVLTGLYIVNKEIEFHADYKGKGLLKREDVRYEGASIAVFGIFLDNHKMFYIRNDNQAPYIGSFASHSRYIIKRYMKGKSDLRAQDVELNVAPIPSRNAVEQVFTGITKIKYITFKSAFVPNDSIFTTDLLNQYVAGKDVFSSKTAHLRYNNPDNLDMVKEAFIDSQGIVEPQARVVRPDGQEQTIRVDEVTTNIPIDLKPDISYPKMRDEATSDSRIQNNEVLNEQNSSNPEETAGFLERIKYHFRELLR
jgi:hypothetical protein